ncbi:MAG: hypothetical protein ACLFTK_02630 [Anaerolineales bacterium]
MLRLLPLFIVLAVSFYPPSSPATAQIPCQVSEIDQETFSENSRFIFRVLAMMRDPNSPLQQASTVGIYHTTLGSMRDYHHELATRLPGCAQPLNTATIQTISAAQDVLAMMLLADAVPGSRSQRQVERQFNDLLDQYQLFLQVSENIALQVEG